MVIRKGDRVSAVLRHDESLIDVFTGLSPVFERLRNPGMRKVMAQLVTVEQAARMAGVAADELVRRLNDGVRTIAAGPAAERSDDAAHITAAPTEVPAGLRAITWERIVTIDVRDDLRSGREPFSSIMAARRSVPDGGALGVRAIFEPVPLYAVMAQHGLAYHTEQLGDDDWQVWFYPAEASPRPRVRIDGDGDGDGDGNGDGDNFHEPGFRHSYSHGSGDGRNESIDDNDIHVRDTDEGVVVLDVRNMEPPEPMMRTLAALETLPQGGTLVQINVRVPQFLLPRLEERGFTYEIRQQAPDLVRVFIRRASA